jgi:hypothetical protein
LYKVNNIRREAAPMEDTVYFVGGILKYVLDGVELINPLYPDSITVKPDPILVVKYFLQRDVYSDDPFTPEIEPAVNVPLIISDHIIPKIPFNLGMMLHNMGYGKASDMKITSGQPQIIENTRGLLIRFTPQYII